MGTTTEKGAYLNTTKQKIKQGINNLGGSLTSSSTFRSYATELDTVYNKLPKVSDTGTDITLTPTLEARLGINPRGNTEQDSTTGKNVLPNTATSTTVNGITFTINEDGTVTANGTATANSSLIVNNKITLNGTYTISSGLGVNSNYFIRALDRNNGYAIVMRTDSSNIPTATIDTDVQILIYIMNGVTCNNLVFKPMLEAGSTATSYEPYTGGQASPNPSYPQNINVVTGENSVKVENKNLLSSEFEQGARNNSDGTTLITSNNYVRTINKIDVQDNTQYIVSLDGTLKSGDVHFYNNATFLSKTNTISAFTTPENCNKINIQFYDANGISVQNMGNVQLEKGTTATDYVEHEEQNYTLNLGNIELVEIGNYADYIEGTPDNWVKKEVIGKDILDGSEAWSLATNQNYFILYKSKYPQSNSGSTVYSALSNYYVVKSFDTLYNAMVDYGFAFGYTSRTIAFRNKDITSIENFKAWLSTHNTTVYYVLATSTDVPITDTTLISQLNALYYANSYDDETNISSTYATGNMPMRFTASALKGE